MERVHNDMGGLLWVIGVDRCREVEDKYIPKGDFYQNRKVDLALLGVMMSRCKGVANPL